MRGELGNAHLATEVVWMAVALVVIAVCAWAMSMLFTLMQQFILVLALFFEMWARSPL